MPGEYRVTLVVEGKDIATKPVRVIGDAAVQLTDADRKTWHDTALALHRLQEEANEAAEAVTQLGTQYQALETLMKMAANAPAEAKTAVEAAGKQLADLRRRLGVAAPGQPRRPRWRRWRWRWLWRTAESERPRPTSARPRVRS